MKKMEKKYIPLAEFFQKCPQTSISLTFEALETILGQELPNAAYLNASWWKKTKPPLTHYLCWTEANYNVVSVKLGHSITFSKNEQAGNHALLSNAAKQTYIIRSIESDDARNFINLLNAVYKENTYIPYAGVDSGLTVQQIRKRLLEIRKSKNTIYFISVVDGKFAGYASVIGNEAPQKKHVARVEIGVLNDYQRIGIGNALLQTVEKWAEKTKIKRLEASIVSVNEPAFAFFKTNDFIQEGIAQHAFSVEDQLFNELLFAKTF